MAALLQKEALPSRYIEEHLDHYLVLRDGSAVWGCAGLEVYADSCLLRSLVIDDAHRHEGWGSALLQELIGRARQLHVRDIIALTSTAAPLLGRYGFVEVERECIGVIVRNSWQFSEANCACATCMRLVL